MTHSLEEEILEAYHFLKQTGEDHDETPSLFGKTTPYLISTIGRLFVMDYRILEFLPRNLILLCKCFAFNPEKQEFLILSLMDKNRLKEDREFRLSAYKDFTSMICSMPMKGTYRVMVLYISTLSYSFLTLEEMAMNVTPTVSGLKFLRFFSDADKKYRERTIDCKQAGTLLHAIVDYYVSGKGWINNQPLLIDLYSSKLLYNPERVIHTINYIIGLEMVQGGYEEIATEKLFEVTNPLEDDHFNFNRLDLLLRNEHKVLVIDWKFTFQKAKDYIRGYKHKVQKYLRLAKKYYKCEVEFRLYCIHKEQTGILHKFTTETVHFKIPTLTVENTYDSESESDVVVLEHNTARVVEEENSGKERERAVEERKLREEEGIFDEYYNKHIEAEINRLIEEGQGCEGNGKEEAVVVSNSLPKDILSESSDMEAEKEVFQAKHFNEEKSSSLESYLPVVQSPTLPKNPNIKNLTATSSNLTQNCKQPGIHIVLLPEIESPPIPFIISSSGDPHNDSSDTGYAKQAAVVEFDSATSAIVTQRVSVYIDLQQPIYIQLE